MDSFFRSEQSGINSEIEMLATAVIGAAIEVHDLLGPGLPEQAYKKALSHELSLRSLPHQCEAPVPVIYKGLHVADGRVDLLVDSKLVVELKVVDRLAAIHVAQTVAYLSALGLPLGLLINFNVTWLKDGLQRVIRTS